MLGGQTFEMLLVRHHLLSGLVVLVDLFNRRLAFVLYASACRPYLITWPTTRLWYGQ